MPEVVPAGEDVPAQVLLGDVGTEGRQPAVPDLPDLLREELLPGLLHGGHQPVDGLAQGVELGLVVRHDPNGAVLVEVPRDLGEGEAVAGDLLHGELEEGLVVGLEVDLAAGGEHLAVALQEVPVGQAAAGVAPVGPGIAEVDVDPVHLAGGKEEGQLVGVGVQEEDVMEPGVPAALHGHHHGVRHHLDGDEQHVRLRRGGAGGEAALAAAQLHPELPGPRHQGAPLAGHGIGVGDEVVGTALHPGQQVFLLAHSHGGILLCGPAGGGGVIP